MKQDRPSFRVYRTHFYRQFFGRSLSVKPITSKYGESYAILNSTPYKLFWLIFIPLIFIITIAQGYQFGLIPLLAAIGLYIIVAMIRYFFAGFVKLEDDELLDCYGIISYEMCDDASKDTRPPFSAYLKYCFVPTRSRYKHLIKDEDGREYYQVQRQFYPEGIFFYSLGYIAPLVGLTMGTGLYILLWPAIYGLILLLSPLFQYLIRFKRINAENYTFLEDDESSSVLYKIFSGIFICAGVAILVLGIIFIFKGSYESEEINAAKPATIEQAYDYSLSYMSNRFEQTDLTDFYIKYDDINAMQSGEPSSWFITFQNTPGLLPRPNETMEFSNHNNISLYHHTYETIRPTYDARLVTSPSEILAILRSKDIISSDSDISFIIITTADYSIFKIHDPEECQVRIGVDGQGYTSYIVNIRDKTARLE